MSSNFGSYMSMNEQVKWSNLTRFEIAQLLKEEGITVSVTAVDQLLEKHKYSKRKAQKRRATGEHPKAQSTI